MRILPPMIVAVVVTLIGLLAWLPAARGDLVIGSSAAQEKILVSVDAGGSLPDATVYTLNPDGGGQAPLFNFHAHPKDPKGGIWDLRVAADGAAIYFNSDNARLYTPASRNLFRISADGGWWDQVTPGPNSGLWNQGCPCGAVTVSVRKSNGDPWGNSPVFLEGKDPVNSNPDGSFRFDDVPAGVRWIVAYRPGDSNVFAAQSINVIAGLDTPVQLVPDSTIRMNFERPAPFSSRIYYRLWPASIQWTTADFAAPVEVYKTTGFCTGIPDVDGFDVAPTSGGLAIVNYQEGCGVGDTEHQGLYLADKDGGQVRLLVNMMADWNWCGAQEVFWSADESRLAVKACYKQGYQRFTYLVVFDASTGSILGAVYFSAEYSLANVNLHGWSPDGRWLLYSSWLNDAATGALAKLPVNADGSLNSAGVVLLLSNTRISGAAWGLLNPQAAGRKVYLPLLLK